MNGGSISSALEIILEKFDHIGWSIRDCIRTGRVEEAIVDQLERVQLNLHSDMVEYFRCMNGVDYAKSDALRLMFIDPYFYPMSLEESLDRYRSLRRTPDFWDEGLIPIFTDAAGLYVAMQVKKVSGAAKLYMYDPGDGPFLFSNSIYEFLIMNANAIEAGIIFVNSDSGLRSLDCDDDLLEEMRARYLRGESK
ncbi:MAG: hypothetical protein ROR55_09540 [Devosia sp.]